MQKQNLLHEGMLVSTLNFHAAYHMFMINVRLHVIALDDSHNRVIENESNLSNKTCNINIWKLSLSSIILIEGKKFNLKPKAA